MAIRGAAGPLANIALLERELGQIVYRMAKGEAGLEERKAQLIEALDREHARSSR